MQVVLAEPVQRSLATPSRDDRERVQTWFNYLSDWDRDPFVRDHSVPLQVEGKDVFMFRTSTDVRIFYTIDAEVLTVINVARKETVEASGRLDGAMR